MFATDWLAASTRARCFGSNAKAAVPKAPAVRRNVLRLHIFDFISVLLGSGLMSSHPDIGGIVIQILK
jgi:hypothetical protein